MATPISVWRITSNACSLYARKGSSINLQTLTKLRGCGSSVPESGGDDKLVGDDDGDEGEEGDEDVDEGEWIVEEE